MVRLKYKGGIAPEYAPAYAAMPVGSEADYPDVTAAAILEKFPGSFEVIETRKVDAPGANRMKSKPPQNRSKT